MPTEESVGTETRQPDAVGARWLEPDQDLEWHPEALGVGSNQTRVVWIDDLVSNRWNQEARDALDETSTVITILPKSDPAAGLDNPRSVRNRILQSAVYPAMKIEGRFHGVVLDVFDESFAAQVANGNPNDPPLVAEFPIDELPSDDQETLAQGSVFHITVATDRGRPGRPVKISAIRLQRFMAWPAEDVEAARSEGRELASWLKDEFDDD